MKRLPASVLTVVALCARMVAVPTPAAAQPRTLPVERYTGAPYSSELWVQALRRQPTTGDPAFGVTLEGALYDGPRAHDRWRRNVYAEALAAPMSWIRGRIGYDPESALVTGAGGFHVFAEGAAAFATRLAAGGYARFDRAADDARSVEDFEFGGQIGFWSDERRVFLVEKLGYRSISGDVSGSEGTFVQLRHQLTYVPSEDWTLTFVQEGDARIGIGEGPYTNVVRFENMFLLSPSLLYTVGPVVGVNLDYFVGPATSALSVPIGLRGEIHAAPFVVVIGGTFDVATIAGQSTAGLVLRAAAGMRF